MKKVLRTFVFVVLVTLLCFSAVFSASAEEIKDKGFIEFETERSINFEEIIEVVLTDDYSGHYYTQRLYRINDYAANISVPMGYYSVSARVLDNTGQELSQYDVVCLTEDVYVSNAFLAEVVSLKVEEFAVGDVSSEPSSEPIKEESSGETSFALVTEDDTCPTPTSVPKENQGRSVLTSALVTFVAFVVGLFVFFYIKKKRNE